MSARDSFWQRWYSAFLVALWVLIPEVRRVIDWQLGFSSLSVINLIPLVALVPLIALLFRRHRASVSREFMLATWLWIGAFGYAFMVGWLSGNSLAAVYDCGLFSLPLLVGFWLASMEPSCARRTFDRFVHAALWLGAIASIYGIYQFSAPPPWDVLWVNNSGLGSIGVPEPFRLRIFGPMNAPGVFADFLAIVILLTLHRLNGKTMWLVCPLFLCSFALALTFVRTSWLELALGLFVYVLCSPRRVAALATVGAVASVTLCLALNLSLITGNPASNSLIIDRMATLNDLQNDSSASMRAQETRVALRESVAEPLGQGLGTVGTSTKLAAAGANTVLDNGYLSRFVEMGVFGFTFYLATLASVLVLSVMRFRAALAAGDANSTTVLSTSIAVQVALIGGQLSADNHGSLTGIVFWMLVGFSSTLSSTVFQRGRFGALGHGPGAVI
jgi:putative inorganic carbon (HCO3(-)) transporter